MKSNEEKRIILDGIEIRVGASEVSKIIQTVGNFE